jgi:drug/metabolite transporter (DMT)-like permease
VVGSAALELLYIVLLAAAYKRADLSVVYPVARGGAPVLVLLVGVAALGVGSSTAEVAGVVLVALGVLLVRGLRPEGRGVTFGLALAACIAAYTLVDARGVEHASPFAYLELVMAVPALAYAAALGRARGFASVRAELGPATVLAAFAVFGAFGLALAALKLASAASVAAVRETSVVIAVALAAPVLRERVGPRRLAGAGVVVIGVIVLSL